MKKQITFSALTVLMLLFCQAAYAMEFDPNTIAEITTGANHQVVGYGQGFALSGNVAVWVDERDPEWITRIYGVNLDDANHLEFVIDLNAPNCYQLAISGNLVVYSTQAQSGPQYLRVANITNQNNPSTFNVTPLIPYVNYFDISGSMIAYSGSDPNNNRDTVYAADITDPCSIQQYKISVLPENHYVFGLTIDADYLNWSVEYYDANNYVQVADITNPSEPDILTAQLPAGIYFANIDASGQWLLSQGQEDWRNRIYAVHNYKDSNNWDIQTLWREGENGEYYVSGPRIDGPITVWVTSNRMPSLRDEQQAPLAEEDGYKIKASYLMENGDFSLSTLLVLVNPNQIGAADISRSQVVWSKMVEVTDLFKASIELECGDWGYKLGDLNRDCKVDFKDFAIFAQDWLECTFPDDENCGFGTL